MKKQLKRFIKQSKRSRENSLTSVATWLPLFTGFYESFYDPSDHYIEMETELSEDEFKEYYEELHDAGVNKEFFDANFWEYLDFQKGHNGVAEYVCDALVTLEHCNIIKDVEYEKVVSPRFYNFSNDSINCTINYSSKKLMKYLKEHQDELNDYIKERYTSRSGFISSYDNDLDYWMNKENHGDHEVGSLLQFVLLNEDKEAEMALYYESNCLEGFMNSVVFDSDKMIKDFKSKSEVA